MMLSRGFKVAAGCVAAGVAYALFGRYFNFKPLLNVDWQAIGAVATFLAAGLALYIAGNDARERSADRQRQATTFAAYTLPEIIRVARLVVPVRHLLGTTREGPVPRNEWLVATGPFNRHELELIRESIDFVHKLDGTTAFAVASTLAMFERMKATLEEVGPGTATDDVQLSKEEVVTLRRNAAALQRRANGAADALWRLVGTGKRTEIDGSELTDEEAALIGQAWSDWAYRGHSRSRSEQSGS